MNTLAKLAAAAAVVVLAVMAFDVMVPGGDVGGSAPASMSSSPPAATPQPTAPSTGGVNPLSADYTIGRQALDVDGVRFSFDVPTAGWEPYGSLHISKSTVGGQGAEAVLFWARFPDGVEADPCNGDLDDPRSHSSAADLAAVVATAAGTERVAGPSEATVGGRAAQHVVLTVREDLGCDPGYFYNWKAKEGGAFWQVTRVGYTMLIWIVETDRGLFFIGGITHPDGMPYLGQEIEQIVVSMRFE
ncbi:MAG TPA: hypothetical protein VFK38_10300 [Candidatus Limnocylindrales bacterium]|nr:hypothetical protein [Candidatus Limnocylindrales bacterium]